MPDRALLDRWGPPVVWVLWTAMIQWSVVRFRVSIVLVLTLVAVGLLLWATGRLAPAPSRVGVVGALLASAAVGWVVPLFTHLSARDRGVALAVVTAVAVAGGALFWRGRAAAVLAVCVIGQVVLGFVVVRGAPAPPIDVWAILQRGADALAHGENIYAVTITGSHGVSDFTYLPWTSVLLAPGRLLFGDVRWALLFWSVVVLLALAALGRRSVGGSGRVGLAAAGASALVVTLPGSITQIDQAWTEPLLAAGLLGWAVLVASRRPSWAVVPLALVLASKQHIALLLPLLACWPAFGVRRTAATAGLAGALVLPWFLADPGAFLHDTVTLLVGYPPLRFSNTWVLLAQHELGATVPVWVTGGVVLAVVVASGYAARRHPASLSVILRWMAVVLLVANLANKQAFYNQFWLSAVLVLAALVSDGARQRSAATTASQRATSRARLVP